MHEALLFIGRVAGFGGALVFVAAIALRVSGHFVVGGYQVGTLMFAGTATMILGCLCLLLVLTSREGK